MKEKDFDTRLKDALDHLEVPYDPASWALLEQRLAAPFAEENPAPVDEVDKAVFHKLQQIEAPYQPAHWDMLANRLTNLQRLKLRLRVSKIAEAAILLLLLANLQGSWFEKSTLPAAKPKYNGPVAATQTPSATKHRLATAGITAGDPATDQPGQSAGALSAGILENIGNQNQGIEALQIGSLFPPSSPETATLPSSDLAMDLSPVAGLPAELFLFTRLPQEPALPFGSRVAVAGPRTRHLYFATFAAMDRNRVTTGDAMHLANGYSAGFMLGMRYGKWGVEAGLAYSQKQYVPKKKIEIYDGNVSSGYFGSFLGEVDADVVSVPIKVTRRIARVGRTSVHAVAGATANIATQKAYHYKTIQFPGSAPSSQGGNTLAEQPRLRETGRGVLENGRLSDNIYFSADLGVRIERPIAGRWTAFVEPSFRQALSSNGLGPNPAKINSFGIQAGVMAAM